MYSAPRKPSTRTTRARKRRTDAAKNPPETPRAREEQNPLAPFFFRADSPLRQPPRLRRAALPLAHTARRPAAALPFTQPFPSRIPRGIRPPHFRSRRPSPRAYRAASGRRTSVRTALPLAHTARRPAAALPFAQPFPSRIPRGVRAAAARPLPSQPHRRSARSRIRVLFSIHRKTHADRRPARRTSVRTDLSLAHTARHPAAALPFAQPFPSRIPRGVRAAAARPLPASPPQRAFPNPLSLFYPSENAR